MFLAVYNSVLYTVCGLLSVPLTGRLLCCPWFFTMMRFYISEKNTWLPKEANFIPLLHFPPQPDLGLYMGLKNTRARSKPLHGPLAVSRDAQSS